MTGLVHEAYLRLVNQRGVEWQSRAHFFGVAGKAMRSILVDHARARVAVEETAAVLGVSPATVKRQWQVARAWLKQEPRGS